MADKDIDSKLDKIAEHMEKVHNGVDEMRENHKALSSRLDAIEKAREQDDKARKDAANRARRDGESDSDYDARMTAMDAALPREGESELEREDRSRRDRVRHRVDAEERNRQELADRNRAAEIQLRADRAYQAWGLGQAPSRAYGEAMRDFEIRLLRPLLRHSARYKDSSLETIGDATVFNDLAGRVIADAVEASCTTVVEGAPLRMITERNENGHTVRKFYGDPAVCWAPFMGGAVRIAKLQRPASK